MPADLQPTALSNPLLRSPPTINDEIHASSAAPNRLPQQSLAQRTKLAVCARRRVLGLVCLVLAGAGVWSQTQCRSRADDAAYVAMCLIVKDQPRDVVEWVRHHEGLGVGKFYIYDHNSSVPLITELHPLTESGLVRYQYFRNFTHPSGFPQSWVFDQCLSLAQPHHFMIFVDTDEFVVLKRNESLPQLLQNYENYGALVPNVRLFGSSGHRTRPHITTNAYTDCAPLQHEENKHVKVAANIRYTVASGPDPHTFLYVPGKFAVTEEYERVDGAKSAVVSEDKIAVYHYATRSEEEFQDKVQRGPAHGLLGKTNDFFKAVDELATDSCYDAIKNPEVKLQAQLSQQQRHERAQQEQNEKQQQKNEQSEAQQRDRERPAPARTAREQGEQGDQLDTAQKIIQPPAAGPLMDSTAPAQAVIGAGRQESSRRPKELGVSIQSQADAVAKAMSQKGVAPGLSQDINATEGSDQHAKRPPRRGKIRGKIKVKVQE